MTSRTAPERFTVAEVMQRAAATLRAAGAEDPVLEAELLLRHVLGIDKTSFYLRLQGEVTAAQSAALLDLVRQRLARRPLAYVIGHREFYDLDLYVAPGVLIPRPETELVVEHCLALGRAMASARRHVTFVDVGTGCGAIALAVAKHLPSVEVVAIDISPAALAIAGLNAKRLRLAGRVRFLPGDLLGPLHEQVDLVAANLPYIPTAALSELAPEVRDHEPALALDGGPDGLHVVARLLAQLPRHMHTGGAAVLEIDQGQAPALRDLVATLPGVKLEVCQDLAGLDRVAVLRF